MSELSSAQISCQWFTTCATWDVANPPHDPERRHHPTHPTPELWQPWDIFSFSPRTPAPSHPVAADTEVRQEQPGSPHHHPSVCRGRFDNKFLNFMDSLEFPGTLRSRSILGWRHKEAPSMLSGWAGRPATRLGRPSAAAVPLAKSTRICSPPCGCNHPHFDQTSTRFLTSLRQAPLKELSGYFPRYNLLLLFRRRGTLSRAVIGPHSGFFFPHLFFSPFLQLHIARCLPRKCSTISRRPGSETLLERRAAAWHLRKGLQRGRDMIPRWLLQELWYEIKAVS